MKHRMLSRAALIAATTLPVAFPAFATVAGSMRNITPDSFQSFNADADVYAMHGGVVTHTAAIAPGPGTGRQMGVTPASFQSFVADEDRYTLRNGVTTMKPASALPPAAPMHVAPYASVTLDSSAGSAHLAGAWKYVTAPGRTWVPAQGVAEPTAQDGPQSLKGE